MSENFDIKTLPTWELNNFYKYIAKATEEYMKDPENKRRFEIWKKDKDRIKKVEHKCN